MSAVSRTPTLAAPRDERGALGTILAASAAAVGFLIWLLYIHQPPEASARQWIFLPQLDALMNGLSATALCIGWYFIKTHRWRAHRASMLSAFAFSTLFLIGYIVNHALHGDTLFPRIGGIRAIYLALLASHIIASVAALPMILTTFYFAWRGDFTRHRRLARFTFPIWLYVSVTGVVVFLFLKAYVY